MRTKFLIIFLALTFCTLSNAQPWQSLTGDNLVFEPENPGQTSLLIVWASWCRFCMAEIPELKEAHKRYPAIRFLGLNVNKKPEDGLSIEKSSSLPYPSISDPDLKLADKYKVRGTPDLILLSKSGEILARSNRFDDEIRNAPQTHAKEN